MGIRWSGEVVFFRSWGLVEVFIKARGGDGVYVDFVIVDFLVVLFVGCWFREGRVFVVMAFSDFVYVLYYTRL